MTTPAGDDEWGELYDANLPRLDVVGKGANGVPRWLVMKEAYGAGLMDPEFVRELIAKETPVPVIEAENGRAVLPNGIHLSGSPAAMAAFIHAANVRKAEDPAEAEPVAKEKYSADEQRKMLTAGQAIKNENGDPAYMIGDKDDLGKAIHAVGRGGPDHDRIRAYVIRRAKALGASSEIPDDWNSDGSLKGDVSKEADVPQAVTKDLMTAAGDAVELDDGIDGMDPTVPLAAPADEMDVPGDPTDPGSPAWEAIDAATAGKWLSILARAKNALCLLAEREMLEAASADPDDIENAWDLDDAGCAIDYAIGQLAVFAAGEQAEAELGAEMAEIGKAVAGAEAPVGVIEVLAPVRKSGRVLSASNEAKLRSAAQAIGEVLSSLPQAPDGVAKSKEAPVPATKVRAAQVAKETASPEAQAADAGPVSAGGTTGLGEPRETGPAAALPGDGPQAALPGDVPGRTVVKGALRVAVRDMTRRLVLARADRIRDPAEHFAAVAKADGDADGKVTMQAVFDEEGNLVGIVDPADITPVSGAGGGSDDGADDGAAAPAPAADDMTPQPPADAGTPADAVGKAAQDVTTATPADLGSIIAKAVADALGALPVAEDVAKSADVAAANARADALEARIAKVEETPAAPRVFTNGAVPPAHTLRGQDQGTARQVDVTKAMERKAELYSADAPEQARIAKEMQGDAIAYLEALHAGR